MGALMLEDIGQYIMPTIIIVSAGMWLLRMAQKEDE